MRPLYSLKNISFSYAQGFSLTVDRLFLRAGAIYALVGQNGSGKSTLLKIIAFLLRPEQGELFWQGKNIHYKRKQIQELRRQVTLVDQNPYLFAGTVAGNISFGLRLRGLSLEQQERRVTEALQQVGLGGFAEQNSCQLSCGERQRVSLARALALDSPVLLLDEPTANSDLAFQKLFERLVVSLKKQGKLIIIATHDLEQARRLGGEVLHLEQGRLIDGYSWKREQAHDLQMEKHYDSIP